MPPSMPPAPWPQAVTAAAPVGAGNYQQTLTAPKSHKGVIIAVILSISLCLLVSIGLIVIGIIVADEVDNSSQPGKSATNPAVTDSGSVTAGQSVFAEDDQVRVLLTGNYLGYHPGILAEVTMVNKTDKRVYLVIEGLSVNNVIDEWAYIDDADIRPYGTVTGYLDLSDASSLEELTNVQGVLLVIDSSTNQVLDRLKFSYYHSVST
jgi:hypothetical protein